MAIVEFRNVSRVYRNGDHEQRALDHVDLNLEEGKFIVVLGPSGAGKSTLLNMLGGLDSPTEGTIVVNGEDISTLTPNDLAAGDRGGDPGDRGAVQPGRDELYGALPGDGDPQGGRL